MSKWDEMTERERDAWVATHLFDWRWMRFDGHGGFPKQHVACVPPETAQRTIFNYPKDTAVEVSERDSHPRFSDWDRMYYRDGNDDGLQVIPEFTTDASADYLVLCKVREEWDGNKHEEFIGILECLFGHTHWGEGNAMAYQPGDYSHAAYLALEGSDDA